jgi:hypothetical protein
MEKVVVMKKPIIVEVFVVDLTAVVVGVEEVPL